MSTQAHVVRLSSEEYLDAEKKSEIRHEYVRGQLFDMVGGTDSHNLISQNVAYGLRERLSGRSCRVFVVDKKVRIASADVFYYPDVFVTCAPEDRERYFKERPSVIVEVLSDSTENIERREKFLTYELLPSLREYVLVQQVRREIEVFRRDAAKGAWTKTIYSSSDDVPFESLGVSLSVPLIYEGVDVNAE